MTKIEGVKTFSICDIPDLTEVEKAFLSYAIEKGNYPCNSLVPEIRFKRCFAPIGGCSSNWVSSIESDSGTTEFWVIYRTGETMGVASRYRGKNSDFELLNYTGFKIRPASEAIHLSQVKSLPEPDAAVIKDYHHS